MNKYILVTFLSIIVIPISASAHSGRTDANGCHTNKKTGEYHCHSKIEESIKLARTEARTEARNEVKTEAKSKEDSVNVKQENPNSEVINETNDEFVCSGKKICADMTSCEEAYFQLNTCGLSDLDRDRDGVPCEVICGNSK